MWRLMLADAIRALTAILAAAVLLLLLIIVVF
jgi:hypothetical protein